jgi:hypothetical protein
LRFFVIVRFSLCSGLTPASITPPDSINRSQGHPDCQSVLSFLRCDKQYLRK